MNAHRRMEAKRARRRARTTGATRGKVRGPVTRGAARAELMREGEERLLRVGLEIKRQMQLRARARTSRRGEAPRSIREAGGEALAAWKAGASYSEARAIAKRAAA